MEVIDCEQGSDAWLEAKMGMVSSSHFSDVLNKKTGRTLYMRKVAGEILTGAREESFFNKNMENGVEMEVSAREYYEKINGIFVNQVGFIKRDDWVGTSPDGLVGDDGMIEIKCVIPSTHINNIMTDKMQTIYTPQVQGQLWVAEKSWCDWISYCPAIKDRPYFCVRVERDEKYIKDLSEAVDKFVKELQEMIENISQSRF